MKKKWTQKEIDFIIENYPNMTLTKLAVKMNLRRHQLKYMVNKLLKDGRLPRKQPKYRYKAWTMAEEKRLRYLKNNGLNAREIGPLLGRSPGTVNNKVNQLRKRGIDI